MTSTVRQESSWTIGAKRALASYRYIDKAIVRSNHLKATSISLGKNPWHEHTQFPATQKKNMCFVRVVCTLTKEGVSQNNLFISAPQTIQHFDWWFWGRPKFWDTPIYPSQGEAVFKSKTLSHTWHPIPHAMASLGCAAWPVASATCHIIWITFGNGCAQWKKCPSCPKRQFPLQLSHWTNS